MLYSQVHYVHDGSSSSPTDEIVLEIELSSYGPLPPSMQGRHRFVFKVEIEGNQEAEMQEGKEMKNSKCYFTVFILLLKRMLYIVSFLHAE